MTTSTVRMLFHVHTRASYDSVTHPGVVVRWCRRNGVDLLVIADHDSSAAVGPAAAAGRRVGVHVIPAVEYTSDAGDIIGLYPDAADCPDAASRPRAAAALCGWIRDRGGLVCVAHPTRGHELDLIPVDGVDLVETANARSSAEANVAAGEWAIRHGKAGLAGADAHFRWELPLASVTFSASRPEGGWTRAVLRDLLLKAPRELSCGVSPRWCRNLSQVLKGLTLRRPKAVVYHSLALCRNAALDAAGGQP